MRMCLTAPCAVSTSIESLCRGFLSPGGLRRSRMSILFDLITTGIPAVKMGKIRENMVGFSENTVLGTPELSDEPSCSRLILWLFDIV